ncbi:VanW family protein [Xylanimonas protaetiae]|uniref:Vanomycin resistance protein VanB n=1 Tax=Xylanimonas protaetiae TaxID=2509457 RepID=A0A4V0YG84_9MICO|nr:VanW family protein [Xylanimonas protaetiae]QAY70321.1 vanomycin resistance protein VanB [Xylanimonas protaetiae]
MGQPTERDNAPEPNTPGSADAPLTDEDVPYVPPVLAYERPAVGDRRAIPTVSNVTPTQALPTVVGHVSVPQPVPAAAQPAPAQASAQPAAQPAPAQQTAPFAPVPPATPFSAVSLGSLAAPGYDGPARESAGLGTGGGPLGGLVGDGQPSRAPRALLMIGGIAVVLAGLYTGAQWLFADKVPTGTQVAGVDLGGLTRAEAVDQLTQGLGPASREPIQITAGQAQTTLDPAAAGLALDAQGTVDQLTGFSMSPGRLWSHLFGGGHAARQLTVDQPKLDAAVAGLVDTLAVAPVDGTVAFTDGVPVATPATDGTTVSADAAAQALVSQWLTEPGPFDLPTAPVAPQITQEETDAALAQAQQIVAGPVQVTVGSQHPELPPEALAAATSFAPVDGSLQLTVDGAKLVTGIVDRTVDLLTDPDDAHFEFQDGRPVVVGGEPGTTLDPAAVATAVQAAALGADRNATVELVQRDPEQSKAALEALGVTEVVSSFSTPLTKEPIRTENLRRGAQLLTGTLVRPGETFSLIDTLSPIDASNGFKAAGVINNGVHTEGMGGGLSQMATTTYNAGFFAGFENVEHRPHSVHFDRYPAGREATIFVGSLDMRFKNNSPYGAVLQSWIEGNQLHVQVWSTKYFHVDTSASDRRNVVKTTTVHRSGASCAAYAGGEDGFTITNSRKVTDPNGKVVINEKFDWTYKPDNPVVCDTPTAPPADAGSGEQ